jgi:hypothetical protein
MGRSGQQQQRWRGHGAAAKFGRWWSSQLQATAVAHLEQVRPGRECWGAIAAGIGGQVQGLCLCAGAGNPGAGCEGPLLRVVSSSSSSANVRRLVRRLVLCEVSLGAAGLGVLAATGLPGGPASSTLVAHPSSSSVRPRKFVRWLLISARTRSLRRRWRT